MYRKEIVTIHAMLVFAVINLITIIQPKVVCWAFFSCIAHETKRKASLIRQARLKLMKLTGVHVAAM